MEHPKVTPDHIKALLANSEIHTRTIFDNVTLVAVRLPSGFVITQSSGAVSKENYSEEQGREICLRKIESELWKLEGYYLQKSKSLELSRPQLIESLTESFLACLKKGFSVDPCAMDAGDPGRIGTSLMSASEAAELFERIVPR